MPSWVTPALCFLGLTMLVTPKLASWVAAGWKRLRPAPKPVIADVDPEADTRLNLSASLCQIADRVELTECPAKKTACQAAVKELSSLIVLKPGTETDQPAV